jgi:hypothetical protein
MSRLEPFRAMAQNDKLAVSRSVNRLNGQCAVRAPGGDSTGARELARSGRGALTPQPKAELAQRASTKEQGKYWHGTAAPPSRGVARGGAKDPTDDPAELDVLF